MSWLEVALLLALGVLLALIVGELGASQGMRERAAARKRLARYLSSID